MLPAVGADAFERLTGRILIGFPCKVTKADDADESLIIIDDGEAPHLRFTHFAGSFLDQLVGMPMKFAEKLFGLTKVGTEVIIEG